MKPWLPTLLLLSCGCSGASSSDAGTPSCDAGLTAVVVDVTDVVVAVGEPAELMMFASKPPCRRAERVTVEVTGPDNRPFPAEARLVEHPDGAAAFVRLTPTIPGTYTAVLTFEPGVARAVATVHTATDRTAEPVVFTHDEVCRTYEVTAAGALLCSNHGTTDYLLAGHTPRRFVTSTARAGAAADGAVWVASEDQLSRFEEHDGGLHETHRARWLGEMALSARRDSVLVAPETGALWVSTIAADGGFSSHSLTMPGGLNSYGAQSDVLIRWYGACSLAVARDASYRVADGAEQFELVGQKPPAALGPKGGWFPVQTARTIELNFAACDASVTAPRVQVPLGWTSVFGMPALSDPVLVSHRANRRVLLDARAATPRFELWEHDAWRIVAVLDEYIVLSDGVSSRVMRR